MIKSSRERFLPHSVVHIELVRTVTGRLEILGPGGEHTLTME